MGYFASGCGISALLKSIEKIMLILRDGKSKIQFRILRI